MSREYLDDAPQRFLAEPHLRDHTALLTRSIADSAPAARTPGTQPVSAFRLWLHAVEAVLYRPSPDGARLRPATGRVWHTRAVGATGAAAANDANYSSAA